MIFSKSVDFHIPVFQIIYICLLLSFGQIQKLRFVHLPGHTPGCCIIEVEDTIFSGDFVFRGSIGRVDFPYSNPSDMKNSINKFLKLYKRNLHIYPGHSEMTTVNEAKEFLPMWLRYI